jgi:hypothetical protein
MANTVTLTLPSPRGRGWSHAVFDFLCKAPPNLGGEFVAATPVFPHLSLTLNNVDLILR